ncbi:MAG: energy transducer TonB, partial [Steroidobacteraceae bacterium]
MNVRTALTTLAALALLGTATARADFNAALREYQAGHYDVARTQFAATAELGDCSSQFNLGAMALHGQGGPKDVGTGAGWLQAAVANGCERLVGSQLDALQARLTDDERRTAAGIVARYGREALHSQGIIDPELTCRDEVPAAVLQAVEPEYPRLDRSQRRNGIVIGELTIGVDGLARDPEILLSEPQAAFAAAAIEAWLNTRFTPATRGGTPVASRTQARLLFVIGAAEPLWSSGAYRDARHAADAGDPAAEYLV